MTHPGLICGQVIDSLDLIGSDAHHDRLSLPAWPLRPSWHPATNWSRCGAEFHSCPAATDFPGAIDLPTVFATP
jgi:hypothetical protein